MLHLFITQIKQKNDKKQRMTSIIKSYTTRQNRIIIKPGQMYQNSSIGMN